MKKGWEIKNIGDVLKLQYGKPLDKVADLYLEMLNRGFYPDYKKENILEIIAKLNANNLKEKAVQICNLYLNKGFEFTRSILEEIQVDEKEK